MLLCSYKNRKWTLLEFIIIMLLSGEIVRGSIGSENDFPFTTVVDILSQNVEFSKFLRILQRDGSISYLNDLQNFTLFAPVNSAFVDNDVKQSDAVLELDDYIIKNNVLLTSMIEQGSTIVDRHTSFPLVFERSRVKDSTIWVNDAMIVDPDLTPNFQNATVHGILALLDKPPVFLDFLGKLQENTSKFRLFEQLCQSISVDISLDGLVTNNTILVPSDNNFQRYFNHLEINYILNIFNSLDTLTSDVRRQWQNDRQNLLQNIIIHGIYGGINIGIEPTTNLNNDLTSLASTECGSKISVNGSVPSFYSNLLFNSGIAHAFNDIQFLRKPINFNAEKYLHGMNSSDFVQEVYIRKLQNLINDEALNKPLTIFVPETSLSEKVGFAKSNLLYHFVEGQIWLEKEFRSGKPSKKMFQSAFCSSNKGLGGKCQKFRLSKNLNGYVINEKFRILHSKPFEIGKNLIYTISDVLQLPGDLVSSLNPFYHCSKSLALLEQINLLDLSPNKQGYTVLLPCFSSWESNELNYEYLKNNETAIELMMRGSILEGLIYTDTKSADIKMKNILGENVSITVDHVDHSEPTEILFNVSTLHDEIRLEKNLDVFFNRGVIHPLFQTSFPKELKISLKNLLDSTGNTNFIHLLDSYDDTSVILEGEEEYSLLIPTKNSLLEEGIDKNFTRLHDWLQLHIIPGNTTSALLDCSKQINTTLGESLVCCERSPGDYFLKLKSGSDNEVRILKKGCSSYRNNSCVFLIDRPLSLQWLRPDRYHLKLPGVAIGIGIVVGALSVIGLLFCILIFFVGKSRSGNETQAAINHSDLDVSNPLLHHNDSELNSTDDSVGQSERRFESSYSANTSRKPIRVSTTKTYVNPI